MARGLLDSDASDSEDGGTNVQPLDLKVNESFARKFEHNKKREELQRLEEKLGQSARKRKRDSKDSNDDDTSDDSTSESEDEGELATETVDREIMDTLQAIRSKDPRLYDGNTKFYSETNTLPSSKPKSSKPMTLQDYHRQNLLNGDTDNQATPDNPPLSYDQEQALLKQTIIGEIKAVAGGSSDDEEMGPDNGEFLAAKPTKKPTKLEPELDVENADKDPELFLSNFMTSRAWAAPSDPALHPFESDDDDDDRRADEYEEAYNLRFEDPAKSNEKLRSHARDMAEKYSVRREQLNPRQKKREEEKRRKEEEKQQRKEDKARLRRLKIEELEDKVRRIKKAAGIRTQDLKPEDWSRFVDDEWNDAQWEEEMQKRFDDNYYAAEEVDTDEDAEGAAGHKKRKVRKPKFDDDIDIKDIIPDFDDQDKAEFSLSEDDKLSKRKRVKKENEEKRRDAKKERRLIEQLVDDQLQLELDGSLPSSSKAGFRYRETSPKTFGLTSRDILLADDKQLNEFAGLKKLASFRDPEKKRKDLKHLGKKARLRKWRLDTFGSEEGLQGSQLIPAEDNAADEGEDGGVDIRVKGKKKRRNRSKKVKIDVES
ncbi:hypothetical protein PV10_07963 [Exophiala mesophila]|uniref:Kri1-like C-terminal domain-containing protein n=1 Tax=Exophiala mesophila TaxID=212818 RepID=A0A0D1XJ95_EXOME|nr:uncharacterized protein PV10_07963 [Exophiala mesophila]KIV88266.1 hypothetical protein PV10_07963 [Exophiala mesophila]